MTDDCYILLRDKSSVIAKIEHEGLHQDGHPTYNPLNKNEFVSDTYEDEKGYRNLFICNMQSESIRHIDKLKSNSEYDNTTLRCDLHPRWSYDGKYICIDMLSEDKRSVYLYKIEE